MANIEKFPLEARGETVSREALVQAALHEITQNYREARTCWLPSRPGQRRNRKS